MAKRFDVPSLYTYTLALVLGAAAFGVWSGIGMLLGWAVGTVAQ